jgi:hypothetical protein
LLLTDVLFRPFLASLLASEDAEDEDVLQEIDEPEDKDDKDACEDKDEDREASDKAFVNEVNAEVDQYREVDEHDIPMLTREDINLGRFSIHKVIFVLILIPVMY